MSNFNVGIQNMVQSFMNQAVGGYPPQQQPQFQPQGFPPQGFPPQGFGQMQGGGGAPIPNFGPRMMAPPSYLPNVGNTLQQYIQPGNYGNWGNPEPSPAPTPPPSSPLGGSSLLTTLLLLKALKGKKDDDKVDNNNDDDDVTTDPPPAEEDDLTWQDMLAFIVSKFDVLKAAGNEILPGGIVNQLPQDQTFGMEDVNGILKNRDIYSTETVAMAENLKGNEELFDLVDWIAPSGFPEGGIHDRTSFVNAYQAANIMLIPEQKARINEAVDYIKTNFDEISAELFNGGAIGNPSAMEGTDLRARIEEMKTGTPEEQRIANILSQPFLDGAAADLVTILTHASGNVAEFDDPNKGFITREGIERFEEIFDKATSNPVTP